MKGLGKSPYCNFENLTWSLSRLQDHEAQGEVPTKKIKKEEEEEVDDENLSMKDKLKKMAEQEKKNKKKTFQVVWSVCKVFLIISWKWLFYKIWLSTPSYVILQKLLTCSHMMTWVKSISKYFIVYKQKIMYIDIFMKKIWIVEKKSLTFLGATFNSFLKNI